MDNKPEAQGLPLGSDDDLNPDDPAVVKDIMDYGDTTEERAREFLRRLIETKQQIEREG